jgi:hypothetical protein
LVAGAVAAPFRDSLCFPREELIIASTGACLYGRAVIKAKREVQRLTPEDAEQEGSAQF